MRPLTLQFVILLALLLVVGGILCGTGQAEWWRFALGLAVLVGIHVPMICRVLPPRN